MTGEASSADSVNLAPALLQQWALASLMASGVPEADAQCVADALVQTSLWGIDSHGILRLTHYLNRIAHGSIDPRAQPTLVRTGPCTAQLDGCHGLGIAHAMRATTEAIALAGEAGVGVVGVGNSSHCGAMGLYTRRIAAAGLVGLAFTHANSVVAPHGGREAFFGTNPISIAFPSLGGEPVCLDMATSQVAWNRVMNARTEDRGLEPGLVIDGAGNATTDPHAARALLPLGGLAFGHKGYGLATMIDLLCGPLNGMPFGPHITPMYEALDQHRRIGHLILALDPQRFAGGSHLASQVQAMVQDLHHGAPVDATRPILAPGEPEQLSEVLRRREGIPVEPGALADMRAWSERLGVAAPA
ncbi:MAG: Ldh family oxidoreductase [Betaproteobacteria bacterium]|nr:Ldh family oxidoreductase [Betaproteobacteria bacterium]